MGRPLAFSKPGREWAPRPDWPTIRGRGTGSLIGQGVVLAQGQAAVLPLLTVPTCGQEHHSSKSGHSGTEACTLQEALGLSCLRESIFALPGNKNRRPLFTEWQGRVIVFT